MNLISRICTAYNSSLLIKENVAYQQDSMWISWIFPKLQDTLYDVTSMNLTKSSFNLSNPSKNFLCFGFDDLYLGAYNDISLIMQSNNIIKKSLINLCVSLGLLRLHNPEGGELPNTQIDYDVEEILLTLDEYFGFKVDFPNIFDKNTEFNWLFYVNYYKDLQNAGIITEQLARHHWKNHGKKENRQCNGEIGLSTSRGIIKERAVHSLFFVSRMKEILKKNIINSTILEIGGGTGRNAYYAKKLGVKNYIIIDLPSSCIMSSYYLGKTLGEENITLFGENTNNYVNILPTNSYMDNKNIDIIFQFDGLTEMGLVNSKNYMDNFIKISPLFLSINHEQNKYTVYDLYKNNKNIERIYRFPSWYRSGYVEELLEFRGCDGAERVVTDPEYGTLLEYSDGNP